MSSETHKDLGKSCILIDDVDELYLNSFCKGYRINDKKIQPLFLNYQILGHLHREMISVEGKGFTRINLRQDKINDLVVFFPPLQEQEQIVNYLDDKTNIIDKLISTKQKKVELLKEQRTSLINQVITKGLNPNVRMKDSGVEWIGKIPESWTNTILRYYVNKVGSGVTPRGGSEVYVDEGVIFIRSQNVHFDGLRIDDVSRITIETHDGMNGSKVRFNDLLLNITGGSIGRCCVVLNDEEMNVNQHVCIIRTKKDKLSPFFLNYITQSKIGQTQVDYFQTGGNREGLTGENIKNFNISFPKLDEQQDIVEYLNKHTKEIDDLVSMEQNKIELLKEYRQSLISEVITGKINVLENNKNSITNTLKINLPYKVLNPKYSKKTVETYGKTITITNGEEYFEPKKELIDFLNNRLCNWVKTENQKVSIENFFKERYNILCRYLPYKDSYYGSWTILKGKDGSILSRYSSTSGIMEDMKYNSDKFLIKTNGEVEEYEGQIYVDEFNIYK
jgi:type I restriction enzyme S subunit